MFYERNTNLGGFKITQLNINPSSAKILSNVSSAYSIFVSSRILAILQIGKIVNVYTAYNSSAFKVAPVIVNQSTNHGKLGTNSSGQLAIWNENSGNVLFCTLIYN